MNDDNGPAIELLSPPDMFKGPTYEHASRVGDFIFIAGQVAKDIEGRVIGPNDAEAQAHAVFESLGKVLAYCGATPDDVVKVTTSCRFRRCAKGHAHPPGVLRRAPPAPHRRRDQGVGRARGQAGGRGHRRGPPAHAMTVPFYNHALLYARRRDDIDGAIRRVLESGRLDWGPEVPAFEAEFAAWVGAPFAVTTNSGTAALKVALLALGIGEGDEVITVANTDIASTSAVRLVGAKPVWVDVDPLSLTMDLDAMRAAAGPRTRAILPVDLFGHPAALPEIMAFARERGLVVIEDACLALGAEIDGIRIGRLADVTCFSFAPTKHLGSLGSGGACVTADAALAQRMQMIAAYGQSRSRHMQGGAAMQPLFHETEGLNERMDEIQAAVLRVKLADVDASLATRRQQAAA